MPTDIQWTDETWNPIAAFDRETGKRGWYCARVSPGCEHCYAAAMNRFRGNGRDYSAQNAKHIDCRIVETLLAKPLSWRTSRKVFVCSMTDLFLDEHTDEMIARVFAVMALSRRHTFQVLTKRPARMRGLLTNPDFVVETIKQLRDVARSRSMVAEGEDAIAWPLPNVHLGTTVEDQRRADERIPELLQTPAAVRWLSAEPLLEYVDILESVRVLHRRVGDFDPVFTSDGGIDWVVLGGESGAGARPFDLAWARRMAIECRRHGVNVFVKQLGAVPMESYEVWSSRPLARLLNARNHKRVPDGFVPIKMSDRHGGAFEEFPEDLQIREFPAVRA